MVGCVSCVSVRTRRTYGDGRWFPRNGVELRRVVDHYIDTAQTPPVQGRIVGGMAPHAGYRYSGAIAGHTFRALRDNTADFPEPITVLVLGFTHRERFPGVALLDGDAIETPLGRVELDREGAAVMVKQSDAVCFDSGPHAGEHSAENEIPFLQVALPTAPLIVALMGSHDASARAAVLDALAALSAQRRVVVLASSDMLHDPSYEHVSQTDRDTLETIRALRSNDLLNAWSTNHQPICGLGPVTVALTYAQSQGCTRGTLLRYCNSGDDFPESRGNWVVGYGSFVFAVDDA